jgi:hypothetical protein
VRYEIASLHKEIAAEQDKTRKLSRDLEEASVRLLVLLSLPPSISPIGWWRVDLADGGGLQKAYRRCEELERQMQKLHEELSQKSREVVKLREECMCPSPTMTITSMRRDDTSPLLPSPPPNVVMVRSNQPSPFARPSRRACGDYTRPRRMARRLSTSTYLSEIALA